jgi:hypothetical protein
LPIHSWKLILPSVVSAVKFGASELMRSDIAYLLNICAISSYFWQSPSISTAGSK